MDDMYKEDTTQAVKAMNDEAVVWGVLSSPLTIAYENFMYDVVAHTCSRKSMNKQWYNDLPPDTFPFLKVRLMQSICITHISALIYYIVLYAESAKFWS